MYSFLFFFLILRKSGEDWWEIEVRFEKDEELA